MKAMMVTVALALLSTSVLAQPSGMSGLGMEAETKGTQGTEPKSMKADKGQTTHKTKGVVKKVDRKAGKVTLAHEPVKSMNWPAMTMTFQVKDKALLDKLAKDNKVEVEFEQRGKEHVITSVK